MSIVITRDLLPNADARSKYSTTWNGNYAHTSRAEMGEGKRNRNQRFKSCASRQHSETRDFLFDEPDNRDSPPRDLDDVSYT